MKEIEPRVSPAPFLGLHFAPLAACSQARRMEADAPPEAFAEMTLPSESITTETVTVVLLRRVTSGLGHPLNVRPDALPVMPMPVPPAPELPLFPSELPLREEKPFATEEVTFCFSSLLIDGFVACTGLSFFVVTSLSTGGAGFGLSPLTTSFVLSVSACSGSPLNASAGASCLTAFSSPRSLSISGSRNNSSSGISSATGFTAVCSLSNEIPPKNNAAIMISIATKVIAAAMVLSFCCLVI